MFQVNLAEKRLDRLEEWRFADLKFLERQDLQEWIARTPDALGEELLVVQKEFDGFAETDERLDLLALDKERQLVVIEIKRDDSGTDVAWQALRYVAYCSTLTTAQIIEIYQKYLERWFPGADAEKNLCDFLEVDELDGMVLNAGDRQRLVLIATNFRKEVTATVLWLLRRGVRAQCFRMIPYRVGKETLVDLRQIIPTPEAADFMIKMAAKDAEETSVEDAHKQIAKLQQAFWKQVLDELRSRNVSRFGNVNPWKSPWLGCGTGMAGCTYNLVLLRSKVRVELYLERTVASENKWIFDQLHQDKETLERGFDHGLRWLRLEGKKASRICVEHPANSYNRETWPEIISWLCEQFVLLDEAFSEPLARLNHELKERGDGPLSTKATQIPQ